MKTKIMPNDKKSLLFHIKNDDYFVNRATTISLLNQDVLEKGLLELPSESLDSLVEELMYLQKHYKIVEK
jgi:hypothetical protein